MREQLNLCSRHYGEARDLPSRITIDLPECGCVRVETPGGRIALGADALARDVRDGKVSDHAARDAYGRGG